MISVNYCCEIIKLIMSGSFCSFPYKSFLTFTITNRYHTPHDCHARLWAMTGGCWQVKADGVLCGSYHTDDLYADLDISFPLGGRDVLVEVTYIPDGAPEK